MTTVPSAMQDGRATNRTMRVWSLCIVGLVACSPNKSEPPSARPKTATLRSPGLVAKRSKTGSFAPPSNASSRGSRSNDARAALVQRLCNALQTLPRARRAACCDRSYKFTLQPECEKRLQAYIDDRSIRLSQERVDGCVAAMKKSLAGCDWPGPSWRPVPRACVDITEGQRDIGQPCGSHLACKSDLHCAGLTAQSNGTCKRSGDIGASCDFGPDPLATVLRQDDIEHRYLACNGGYCRLGRCRAYSPIGQPCGAKHGCGPEARCVEGLCVAGYLASADAACEPGGCAADLHCVAGRCKTPKAPGAACTTDEECYGTCAQDRCARSCRTQPTFGAPTNDR